MLEKLLIEIETCREDHAKRDNTFTESVLAMAYEKLKKYKDLEEQLKSVYGECGGLLEKVVEGLVKHEGVEFEKPMKARLLTDDDVDKWDRLKGAMEQIVERLEVLKSEYSEEEKKARSSKCPSTANTYCLRAITIDVAIEIVKEELY